MQKRLLQISTDNDFHITYVVTVYEFKTENLAEYFLKFA